MTAEVDPMSRALSLLAVDSCGLRGVVLRARAGPVRDRITGALDGDWTRIHPQIDDLSLFGGPDIAATLAAGRLIHREGLLNGVPRDIIVPMAERIRSELSGRLAGALDQGRINRLILLDEGADPEECAPSALRDRVAFMIETSGMRNWQNHDVFDVERARAILSLVKVGEETVSALVSCAAAYGIDDLRVPYFALRAARAAAAMNGRLAVCEDDASLAAQLILAPRATQLPAEQEAPETFETAPDTLTENITIEDRVLEAVRVALPAELLARLTGAASAASGTAGAPKTGNRRGRPLPAREGAHGRIDLLATLRAAAPMQGIRARKESGLSIRKADLRRRRYEEHSDRLLVFVIDASGSAALARLAEAKGAVEVLLANAYANRDHVAVISFRGDGSQLLLPPTRALAQARKRLAALPGGGGTPLAAGLRDAGLLARDAQRAGMATTLIVMTDGRGNVALDPTRGRAAAKQDAMDIALALAREGRSALVIDTGTRARAEAREIAAVLRARYLTMPNADPRSLGAAISSAIPE